MKRQLIVNPGVPHWVDADGRLHEAIGYTWLDPTEFSRERMIGFDLMLEGKGFRKLDPDEALVLEGRATSCRHWNIVLYSRFLNSLEHRRRPVSLTGSRVKCDADGNYRIVITHQDPGVPNWLDTEGRAFGLFVIRWLFHEEDTVLPQAKVMKLNNIKQI